MPLTIIYILVFLAILVLIMLINKTRKTSKADYDERQLIIRNESYKHSFTGVLIFAAVYIAASAVLHQI